MLHVVRDTHTHTHTHTHMASMSSPLCFSSTCIWAEAGSVACLAPCVLWGPALRAALAEVPPAAALLLLLLPRPAADDGSGIC